MQNPESVSGLSSTDKRALLEELLKKRLSEATTTHPLSHNQRALWFLHELAPQSPAYNITFAFRIRSHVKIAALKNTLQALLDRHSSLRTTFQSQSGEPVQIVHGYQEVSFQQIDTADWSADELREKLIETANKPFSLENGPVLRSSLFSSSPSNHVLLISIHHIVFDAWSTWIFVQELVEIYNAELKGKSSNLPQLITRYTDFVKWQSDLLASAEGERQRAFWLDQLSGQLPILELPTDYPRPAVQTLKGASHHFTIDAKLTQELRSLVKEEGVTLFILGVAVYMVLLSKYSLQEDFLIGTPALGRSQARFTGVLGDFFNMLVLRADLSGDPDFRTFLQRVKTTVWKALEHQDFPFPLLVKQLAPQRDPSRSPIYQVSFSLLKPQGLTAIKQPGEINSTQTEDEPDELLLEMYPLDQQEGQLDLTLEVTETPDNLFGIFKYNTDLFSLDTIQHMQTDFNVLLEHFTNNPDQSVGALSLLTAEERHRILTVWNQTRVDLPSVQLVHALFEEQVTKTPDRIAVRFENQEQVLTYAALNQRANQLAAHLQSLGVNTGDIVGIYIERSIEMLVALLGVLKAGGAYLPLDPAFPLDRLQFMLSDAQASALVTFSPPGSQNRLPREWIDASLPIIDLSTDWPKSVASHPDGSLLIKPDVQSENLAYIIYTSGSTGKPKGVEIPHSAVVNFLNSMQSEPGVCAEDTLLAVTTLSFDIAVLELFTPLICGAQVVIASRESAYDGNRLSTLIKQVDATILQATPATWRMLIDSGWQGRSKLKALCGGEALPADLAKSILPRVKELWNMYGPTETTVWSTTLQILPDMDTITIGRPIANTKIYILDKYLNPVPLGARGELFISGAGLARGYRHRDELTAEKFIPHPFDSQEGARLYRTGDLARYLNDGQIEFFGRIDHQVKIRGFRIELGEIESILTEHPEIHQAVVLAREDIPGDKRLVAYLIPQDATQQSISSSAIRNYLRDSLPDYMIPSILVFLDNFPLTANGKVDRLRLPVPDQSRPDLDNEYVAPRTAIEAKLQNTWIVLLGVEQVGIYDNFFDLGGHSLLAMQLVSTIRTTWGIEFPLRNLFEKPTIADIATGLAQLQANQVDASVLEALLDELDELSPDQVQELLDQE